MKRPSRSFVAAALLLAVFSTAGNPAVSLASEMEEPAVPVLAETVTDPLAQDGLDVEDAMAGEGGPLGTEDGDPSAGNDPADLVADASGPGQEDDGDPGVSDGGDLEDPAPTTPIGWVQRNGQTYFLLADGTPLKFAQTIDGKQYYFWSHGAMAKNQFWDGRYYGTDGVMRTGWFDVNGNRYYAHYNGGLAKGMAGIDGKVYYFWSGGQMAKNAIWQDRCYGPDGAMYHGCWFIFNGDQYYAQNDGAIAKGQTDIRGKTHCFSPEGHLVANAFCDGRYYGPDGTMYVSRWFNIGPDRYYAHYNGGLAKGMAGIDGKVYYFWSGGQMAKNAIWQDRCYGPDGAMYHGCWFIFNGDQYYAQNDGAIAKGQTNIRGKTHYFWSGGQLARNVIWQDRGYGPDGAMYHGCWFIIGNGQYYAHSNGALAKGQTNIRGKVYYFWSDGTMARNALWQNKCYGPDGAMLSNDWLRFNGNTYYADGSGSPVRFAQTIDGEKYYFWSDGAMAHDCMFQGHYYLSDGKMARFQWVDNEQYWVDADGNWVPNMPAKVGWQNPAGYYQVSSKGPYLGIPSGYYVTSTRINPYSTRAECVETFIQRAWEYVGTPYVWNYSSAPGVGVDCIGLVYQCAYACGMNLGEFNPYDHWITGPYGWHSHDANNMWNYGAIQRLSLGSRNRGDLIFWRGHVAIYLGNDRILEAYPGVVRETSLWAHGTPIGVGRLFL